MITKLSVTNYKIHKDIEVELGKVNFITGMNGVGKTALIEPLLLLSQSNAFMKYTRTANIIGDKVKLKGFNELANDATRCIEIKIHTSKNGASEERAYFLSSTSKSYLLSVSGFKVEYTIDSSYIKYNELDYYVPSIHLANNKKGIEKHLEAWINRILIYKVEEESEAKSHVAGIVSACNSARRDHTVILKNPELYLSYDAQIKLMELIEETIMRGVQFIIETHSNVIMEKGFKWLKDEEVKFIHLGENGRVLEPL